jgi:hypothetical protein
MPSPTLGIRVASAGQSHHAVRPTTRCSSPAVTRISVVLGISETMRRAGARSVTVSPASSTTAMGALDTPGSARQALSARTPASASAGLLSVKQTAHSGQTGNGRTRAVRGWPVSPPIPPPRVAWWRECGGLLASGPRSPSRFPSGALERGWYARYSGGAAPELHRLPRISARVERLPGATILSLNGLRKQELSVPGST